MNIDQRIDELYLDLPEPSPETKLVSHLSQSGRLIFISGQLPYSEGRLIYKGRLGLEVTLDNGRLAARQAFINSLGVVKNKFGTLNKIKKVVRLKLYIATGAEFKDHKKVSDTVMELMYDIFGAAAKCSTEIAGCASLPEGSSVELALTFEVK